jgi:hypothetical protein
MHPPKIQLYDASRNSKIMVLFVKNMVLVVQKHHDLGTA